MAKSAKMTVCKTCNNPIAANAKVCPHCGAKNKKPFFKRGWFILLLVIVVLAAVLRACGDGRDSGKASGGEAPVNNTLPENTKAPAPTEPAEEPDTEPEAEGTEAGETPASEEPAETPQEEPETIDGMRPEFKEAMDSYEAFYDEYCEFMKKYSENPSDLSLLAEYAEMMSRLAEMDEQFEAWEDEDLNTEEMKYYLEVSSRIAAKLLDVAG